MQLELRLELIVTVPFRLSDSDSEYRDRGSALRLGLDRSDHDRDSHPKPLLLNFARKNEFCTSTEAKPSRFSHNLPHGTQKAFTRHFKLFRRRPGRVTVV